MLNLVFNELDSEAIYFPRHFEFVNNQLKIIEFKAIMPTVN